ncbi:proprotein convertase subtilisin/kexin type 4 [Procambarus clarkii]|uniref:proprotein convertase subtilisin/kexin type 4 n=1 Tax=Procambarus clarkii TaxID=6728 RepID=UPI0037442049
MCVVVRVLAGAVWACVGLAIVSHAHSPWRRNTHLRQAAIRTTYHHQDSKSEQVMTNHLAVEVQGGEAEARYLAKKYNLRYVCQVLSSPPVYHLHNGQSNSSSSNRQLRAQPSHDVIHLLAQDPVVKWVDQQISLVRDKRQHILRPSSREYQENSYQTRHRPARRPEIFHNMPTNVDSSRHGMDTFLRRHLEVANRREGQWNTREKTIDDWINEDAELDMGRPPAVKTQITAQDSSDTQDSVSIPLSRAIHNSVDAATYRLAAAQALRDETIMQQFLDRNDERAFSRRDHIPNTQNQTNFNRKQNDIYYSSSYSVVTQGNKEADGLGVWMDNSAEATLTFNDPFFKDQWYLENTGQLGQAGYDLNVTWAWLRGFTGRGVRLSILDDGIQTTNADIAANYLPDVSYSVVYDGQPLDDPSPRIDPTFSNSHGTYCAAIVAAVSNNSVCGVGVAYEAKVGGVRIVDGTVTDIQEATALSRHHDKVDVFSASWGPMDDGAHMEGPGPLASLAFIEGITKGRGGKGIVYVWANGNGGLMDDNCNLDGYTSSIYTLSVSALTDMGTSTFYEEPCASTLAAVYVGGDHSIQDALDQQERHVEEHRVVVPELDGQCSATFQGTSAAAPLMAGVVAIVLHANSNLTWRDVQHLVVETATPTQEALQEEGWHTNGYGKKFHLMQGFGAVNAGKMVEAALSWKNVNPQRTVSKPIFRGYRTLYPNSWLNISKDMDFSNVPVESSMKGVEHVIAHINLAHPSRKLLSIFIVSPTGTTSQVLTHRPADNSTMGFNPWGFMSVHFWGEHPSGTWTVAIKNSSGDRGHLKHIELTIFGN